MSRLLVLSTRPAQDSAELANTLKDLAVDLVALPASEPRLYPLSESLLAHLQQPAELWFFPSRFPVAILNYLSRQQRQALRCACPGPGTAQALADCQVAEIICPEQGYTSEALLALPELQSVRGQRVKVLSAPGGRDALADGLAERGALVDTVHVYERYPLEPTAELLQQLEQSRQRWLSVITSGQGLAHLQRHLGAKAWSHLCQNVVLLPSRRLQQQAEELGIQHSAIITPPDNQQISAYIRTNFDSLVMQPQSRSGSI